MSLKEQGGEEPQEFQTRLPSPFTQWTPELYRWVQLGEAEGEVMVELGMLVEKAKLYAETLMELKEEQA